MDAPFLATSLEDRIGLTVSYSQEAVEHFLHAEFHEFIDVPYRERDMPDVGEEGWLEYLQTPNSYLEI